MTKQNYFRWLMVIYVTATSSLLVMTLMVLTGRIKFSVKTLQDTFAHTLSPPRLTEIDRARRHRIGGVEVDGAS